MKAHLNENKSLKVRYSSWKNNLKWPTSESTMLRGSKSTATDEINQWKDKIGKVEAEMEEITTIADDI